MRTNWTARIYKSMRMYLYHINNDSMLSDFCYITLPPSTHVHNVASSAESWFTSPHIPLCVPSEIRSVRAAPLSVLSHLRASQWTRKTAISSPPFDGDGYEAGALSNQNSLSERSYLLLFTRAFIYEPSSITLRMRERTWENRENSVDKTLLF